MNDKNMWSEFLESWQRHFADKGAEEAAARARRMYIPARSSKHNNGPNLKKRELRAEHVERCIAQSEDEFHASAGGRRSLRPFKLAWKNHKLRKKMIEGGLRVLGA